MNVSVVIETSFSGDLVNTLSQGMSMRKRFDLNLPCVTEAVLLKAAIEQRPK
jgi:hypothetical protein